MEAKDFTIEYCPYCNQEVAIQKHGVTACPECGKPLSPCSTCYDEHGNCYMPNCPYGCTGGAEDEFIAITNP